MSAEIDAWVAIAEADFGLAVELRRSRNQIRVAYACFHAQQCVEKYLKAWLIHLDVDPPKSHNLPELLDLIAPVEPIWETLRPALGALTAMAVAPRYPGEMPGAEEAKLAVGITREVRSLIRERLGLR